MIRKTATEISRAQIRFLAPRPLHCSRGEDTGETATPKDAYGAHACRAYFPVCIRGFGVGVAPFATEHSRRVRLLCSVRWTVWIHALAARVQQNRCVFSSSPRVAHGTAM